MNAAVARGIPFRRLTSGSLVQLYLTMSVSSDSTFYDEMPKAYLWNPATNAPAGMSRRFRIEPCSPRHSEKVGTHQTTSRVLRQQVAVGHQSLPVPADYRSQSLHHGQPRDLRILQSRGSRITEPQPPDRHIPTVTGQRRPRPGRSKACHTRATAPSKVVAPAAMALSWSRENIVVS